VRGEGGHGHGTVGRSVGRSVGSVRFGAGARARATRAAHVIFMLLMRSECASSCRGIRARRAFGLLTAVASGQRLRIVVVQDEVLRVRDAGAVCKGVSDGGANGAPCAGCRASRGAARGASLRVDRDRRRFRITSLSDHERASCVERGAAAPLERRQELRRRRRSTCRAPTPWMPISRRTAPLSSERSRRTC